MLLLREIHFRELGLESLKRFVEDLDHVKDRRSLERTKSKKFIMLYQMTKDLENATKDVKEKIEAFMKTNRRYFGTCFCYQGTDYLVSISREVEEVNETLRVIRNEDDEIVLNIESRLFNGVIDIQEPRPDPLKF